MSESIGKKCAWANKSSENESRSPPITSFVEIMSETLASELQEQDLLEFDEEQIALEASLRELDDFPEDNNDCSRDYELALKLSEDPDYSVDAQMALELQRQFDREHEVEQQLEEQQEQDKKKGKKIILSSDRFELSKLESELQHTNEDDYDEEEREVATDLLYRSKVQEFPPCEFKRTEDGQIITKHDKEIGQRKNCQKMMIFPAEFKSGDIIGSKLSSRIYNDLQMFSKTEQKRNARLKDKEQYATSDASVDVKTRLILLTMINNGVLDRVEGVVAIGKESTVLNGVCDAVQVGTSSDEGPSEEKRFAIKVHKQVLNAFRNRGEYVKDDIRFKNPRNILKVWTEKVKTKPNFEQLLNVHQESNKCFENIEFMNMKRLSRAGLPCPTPIQFKKHVLLMSMIQDESGRPAPKLKNYIWTSEEEKKEIFGQVKEIMIKMFNECKLVHADLSEFNLLFANGKTYVIDFAQAVDLSHPRSLIYLQRDIENVLNFFDKNATEDLPTTHALFSEITSIEVDPEKDLLTQIESLNEQNLFTNLAMFRKAPGNYDLVLADAELDDFVLAESDSDEEQQ